MRFSVTATMTATLAFVSAALMVASDVSTAAGPTQGILPQTAAQPSPQLPTQAVAPDESLSLDTNLVAPAEPLAADSAFQAEADSAPAPSLAVLVEREAADQADLDSEARCLATAVFYEARSESLAGKLAVARVVINRARSGRFPSSLCGVVTQPGQFSFVRGGRLPSVADNAPQWANSIAIANIALEDGWKSQAEGALFFHARYVSPRWGKPLLAQVDNHLFYR
jgi:hypothetical protein